MATSNFTSRPYADQLELWRDVIGYEGYYQVSNFGHVKGIKLTRFRNTERILKPSLDRYGYPYVVLCKDKQRKHWKLHRLVAFAFLGEPPTPQHEINHIDADRANCVVSNLEWVTKTENGKHRYALRKQRKLEYLGNSKLTWEKAKQIRELHNNGMLQKDIAIIFNVGRECISQVVNNKQWVL